MPIPTPDSPRPPAEGGTRARRGGRGRFVAPFLRLMRFLGIGLAGCVASMAISYAVVRHLSEARRPAGTLEPATLREAALFRGYANELVDLANRYFEEIPLDVRQPKPESRAWVVNEFRPRLDELRQRMDRPPVPAAPTYRALAAAADRAAAMAGHPQDRELRYRAGREILRATTTLEDYLAQLGAASSLEEPARKVQFGDHLWVKPPEVAPLSRPSPG